VDLLAPQSPRHEYKDPRQEQPQRTQKKKAVEGTGREPSNSQTQESTREPGACGYGLIPTKAKNSCIRVNEKIKPQNKPQAKREKRLNTVDFCKINGRLTFLVYAAEQDARGKYTLLSTRGEGSQRCRDSWGRGVFFV